MSAPILITGAGNGIGFFCARYLKQHGFPILGHFHHTLSDKEEFDKICSDKFQADLCDRNAVAEMCEAISKRYSTLRGIIHNASTFAPMSPDPLEAYRQMKKFTAIHMLAPFQINLALKKLLFSQAENQVPADIIHITDIYAENPNPKFANYCATKAGLENLSQSFAKQFAPQVKVNTIQPGPISFKPFHDENNQADVIDSTLLNRQGTPEAIAKAILSLFDNDYITGTRLQVDGGRHLTQG